MSSFNPAGARARRKWRSHGLTGWFWSHRVAIAIAVAAFFGLSTLYVAWALKDSATRETNKLVAERKRELKLLDDEFKQVNKDQP